MKNKTKALILITLILAPLGVRCESVFPKESWVRLTASEELWSQKLLNEADKVAAEIGTTAYMVVHKGRVAHTYGNVALTTSIHSVRKSVLSILFGIRIDRCNFTMSTTLAELDVNDREQLSDVERTATVADLLKARSGIYHRSAYEPESLHRKRPSRGSVKPGENFNYNNWDFNALGTIFNKRCGTDVFTAFEEDLAKSLQFEDFIKSRDTQWVYETYYSQHPAYTMRLSTRDMARIGLLMARRGVWDKRLFSEKWHDESTTPHSQVSERTGYGYMWWLSTGDRYFQRKFKGKVIHGEGVGGQYLLIDYANDLVISHKVNSEFKNYREVRGQQFAKLLEAIYSANASLGN